MSFGLFTCSIGEDSNFIDFNEKMFDLLGYTESELKSIQVFDLFEVHNEREEIVNAFRDGIYLKETLIIIRRANGSVLPGIVSLFPEHNSKGEVISCSGIIIDAHEKIWRQLNTDHLFESSKLPSNYLKVIIKNYLKSVPTCQLNETISKASGLMTNSNSSIIVVTDDNSNPIGVVTYGDICRRVLSRGANPESSVLKIMSSPIVFIEENASLTEALTVMHKNGIKNLINCDAHKKVYNCFNIKKLLGINENSLEKFVSKIETSESTNEYKPIVEQFPTLAGTLIQQGFNATQIGIAVSELSDAFTIKFIEKAIVELGEPPAPFAFLTLGSEGRREQTLATDQDNAIIFNPPSNDHLEQCQEYFLNLGKRVCGWLDTVGYPLCIGNVMAMNPDWCMSTESWKLKVKEWITVPNPKEILNTSIFFDYRTIYGNVELSLELQDFYKSLLANNNVFFFNLAKSILNLKIPQFNEKN
mgnify:CR=1 FL=1